jgi:phage I-like protein
MSGAPEWIELLPPGPDIQGRDGRHWRLPDSGAIVAAFREGRIPLPLDYEHATELTAPCGEPSPAAGWIEDLELRANGSIWGRVAWTDKARAMVNSREYRFISPAFLVERATQVIRKLISAALTHHPNLDLAALNRAGDHGTMVLALNRDGGAAYPALTDTERVICRNLGIDPARYAREKTTR